MGPKKPKPSRNKKTPPEADNCPLVTHICLICGKEDDVDFAGNAMRFRKVKNTEETNVPKFLCKLFSLPSNVDFEFLNIFRVARFCSFCANSVDVLYMHFNSPKRDVDEDTDENRMALKRKMEFMGLVNQHLNKVTLLTDTISEKYRKILTKILKQDPEMTKVNYASDKSLSPDSDPFEDRVGMRKKSTKKIKEQRVEAISKRLGGSGRSAASSRQSSRNRKGKLENEVIDFNEADFEIPDEVKFISSEAEQVKIPNSSAEEATNSNNPENNSGNGELSNDADCKDDKVEPEEVVNQFKCSKCPLSFEVEEELQVHFATHDENSQAAFKCEVEGCDSSFSRMENLLRHKIRSHGGRSNYICGFCDKDCKQKRLLEDHLDAHKEYKPTNCRVCGRGFKRDFLFQVAFQMHHGRPIDPCQWCGKKIPYYKP